MIVTAKEKDRALEIATHAIEQFLEDNESRAELLKMQKLAFSFLQPGTPCSACAWSDTDYCRRWDEDIPASELDNGCSEFEEVPF